MSDEKQSGGAKYDADSMPVGGGDAVEYWNLARPEGEATHGIGGDLPPDPLEGRASKRVDDEDEPSATRPPEPAEGDQSDGSDAYYQRRPEEATGGSRFMADGRVYKRQDGARDEELVREPTKIEVKDEGTEESTAQDTGVEIPKDVTNALVASNKLFKSRVGRAEYPGHNPAADLISPEQADHFDRTRAAYENEWREAADIINESRPKHGLFRKKIDPEVSWQDAMRQEADMADQDVEHQMRRQPGFSNTRQEAVEELEAEQLNRGVFHNPIESDSEEYWERSARTDAKSDIRKNARAYWGRSEKISEETKGISEVVVQAIHEGRILEAGDAYSGRVFNERGYFDPRFKAELDKQIKTAAAEALDNIFFQNNLEALATFLGTDLADVVDVSDLTCTKEQRQNEGVRATAAQKAIEFIKYVRQADHDEIGYGWSKPLWLAKRLDRLSHLGITDSYEETASLPAIREAVMDLMLEESTQRNEDTAYYRSQFNWPYEFGLLSKLGLIDIQEFKSNPIVQELCKKVALRNIANTEIDWSFGHGTDEEKIIYLPLARTFNKQMNALEKDGVIDPYEILRSTEEREAAKSFVEGALEGIDKQLERHSGVHQILRTWENYLSKISILFDHPNRGAGDTEPQLSAELISKLEITIAKMRELAETYKQTQIELAEVPLDDLNRTEAQLKELGLAA